jgi:hypothetical protein
VAALATLALLPPALADAQGISLSVATNWAVLATVGREDGVEGGSGVGPGSRFREGDPDGAVPASESASVPAASSASSQALAVASAKAGAEARNVVLGAVSDDKEGDENEVRWHFFGGSSLWRQCFTGV